MTSRRAALSELSAYHSRERVGFPWRAVRWDRVGIVVLGLVNVAIYAWIVAIVIWGVL